MLDVEQRSGVALVRLRHGKVNALDLELLQALTAALRGGLITVLVTDITTANALIEGA